MPETTPPVPPQPSRWQQESFWLALGAVVLGALVAVPEVVTALLPFVDDPTLRLRLLAASSICAALAARFARKPGAEARAKLPEIEATAAVAKERADVAEVKAEVAAASAVEVSERVTAVEEAQR